MLGSAFLKEEPFQHKADIAREEWEEAVGGSKTLELRFKKLPRLARKETYAHKTLIAPFVYGKAYHVTSNATKKEREALQRALTLLGKDLTSSHTELRSKDNRVKETAKAVDALLRRAQTKAGQYISRFGVVHWASLRYDSPAHELMVLKAFEGCRVKQDDPRILRPANWTQERIELMCPPWPLLRYELKMRVAELRAKFDAASDRLEHVRDTWLPAAQKVENSSTNADAGIKEGYARARLDDLANTMSEIGSTAKSVENDPLNNVSTNATINTYSEILKSDGNGSKADAFRTSAQLLMAQATDRLDADFKRAAELASLDAVVASRNTTAARRGALLADSKGYALHRPSEEKLRDLNSAESALHTAQKELDTASEVLEEALAAAAVVQVSAPALEREDIETLQKRYDDAVKEDEEARELLHALDPSHDMAAVASSAKTAADQLVLSLSHRVERDAVDAVLQARKLSEQLREPGKKPSLHCPSELPPRVGVEARLVEVDSVVVLPPAGPGGEARWVAYVPCAQSYDYKSWFDLAQGFAMGLAVLNGKTHVAFGESSGGSLWPGRTVDFSEAEGAWLHRRVATEFVETEPDLIVSLPVHVNGKEYFLDVFEKEDHRLKIADFCKVHMGNNECIRSLTARFLAEADPDSSRREADRLEAEEAERLAREEAERLEAAREAERLEAERAAAERVEAERVAAARAEADRAARQAPKVLVSLPINVGDAEHTLEVLAGEDPMQKLFEFCGKHMGTNAAACVDQLTHHVIKEGGGAEPEPEPPAQPKGVLVSLPIKVDDDREFTFTLLEGEDAMAKVQAFCQAHMGGEASCVEQLAPAVAAQAPAPEPAEPLVSLPIRLDDGREFIFTLLEGEDPMQKIVAFCSASMGGDASCIEQLKRHVTAQGGMAPEPAPARPLLSLPIRVDDGREIAFELYEGEDPAQKLKAFCQHYMGADATSCIKQMTPHVNV